jgi:hypothetical protein
MLLIEATNTTTNLPVDMYHEVRNEGKMTEEHHFSFFAKSTQRSPSGKLISHYVLDAQAAAELKRHL